MGVFHLVARGVVRGGTVAGVVDVNFFFVLFVRGYRATGWEGNPRLYSLISEGRSRSGGMR